MTLSLVSINKDCRCAFKADLNALPISKGKFQGYISLMNTEIKVYYHGAELNLKKKDIVEIHCYPNPAVATIVGIYCKKEDVERGLTGRGLGNYSETVMMKLLWLKPQADGSYKRDYEEPNPINIACVNRKLG